ncbi:alpha/beta hydrolase [Niabella insulamsoli]|uniref:alpha/beta hydrolase n=1 Tax=Niabella insulamsoli TaxID=3144874 RepID=UPI0031FD8161
MKKRMLGLFLCLPFFAAKAWAAKVDTVLTHSAIMKKDIKAVVITPDDYNKSEKYPVVYLLHGYSGNYANWAKAADVLKSADLYQQIVVCADGGFSSWYWDSPVDASMKYETYVSKELVDWIDSRYATISNSKGRAIAGLSMGGHGALYLAIKHPNVFGACGSLSGGVDIRPFPDNWDMSKRLGKFSAFPDRWNEYTVINLLHLIEPNSLKIIIDCGTEDFFYKVNEALHEKLLYLNIPHDYITRPGRHNWPYWEKAIGYQLLFFHQFFTQPS